MRISNSIVASTIVARLRLRAPVRVEAEACHIAHALSQPF